jgi:histidyl-tRNA synthetase
VLSLQVSSLDSKCMNNQLQTLKGFRDFLPPEKRAREYVANKIKTVFELSGFAPIETPTLEYSALLLGKYGEEADKLIYSFTDKGDRQVGLRYDQTVPTARVLTQYQNELPKFFRRYQIQNVFRADKPQKGRFREFTQCDCDIYGVSSSIADAEIVSVFYRVYEALGIDSIVLEINDRATLLQTLSPFATGQVSVLSIIQTIDKLDKLSESDVIVELVRKGLTPDSAQGVLTNLQKAEMSDNLQQIVANCISLGVPRSALKWNPNLARGLDYYTGLIFEGKIPEYTVGSVGGGGRYDNLINELSGQDIPAVGFGIGFDRTVEAVQLLGKLPENLAQTQVLVMLMDEGTLDSALETATLLRSAGIATEIYPELEKLGKQFKLASQKQIPWVVVIGEAEQKQNKVALKNMATGEQILSSIPEVIKNIKQTL